MKIVSGSSSRILAKNLAELLNVEIVHTETKRFPDGEAYVRLFENLDDEDVLLIQSTHPDNNIIELFLLQDAVREFKIKTLTTIIPYFGYGRQDKRFNEGEPVSARVLARMVQSNTDRIILVNLHSADIMKWFTISAQEVKGEREIAEYLKKFNIDIVISPDRGSINRARYVAEVLNVKYEYFEKKRISSESVKIEEKNLDVKDKVVAIVDDVISTGGTIIAASQMLRQLGASKIIVACVHGLFVNSSLQKIERYVDAIISTDTIESEKSVISVASAIKDML